MPPRPVNSDHGLVTEHYDVIIVGSGAGGGTLARTLAPSGKRILLLERGDFLTRETDNWNPAAVFVDGKYISPDTWFDADGKPFQPQLSYDDFEPWYTMAEWLYHVHGIHGEDPTEGSYSRQYPWPPVSHEPRIQEISDALTASGSVLDVNCKAHELDNLYVVDTSFFPSIGAVNPALTAMANAVRVGEHMLSRMLAVRCSR
jgi:choline dehydrogenase-like flavoprotein